MEKGAETTKKGKESFAGLRVLIGSRWAGPWVKGQSGQSCIGSTSCRSSPTSCPKWGRSAGQCLGRTTPSDLPPRRGSCPRWLSPRLRHRGTMTTMFRHVLPCLGANHTRTNAADVRVGGLHRTEKNTSHFQEATNVELSLC